MSNREIKFRFWHEKLNVMLYPPHNISSSNNYCQPHTEVWFSDALHENVFKAALSAHMNWKGQFYQHGELQQGIFMQFTGLKGYEGDIIDVCVFLVSPANPDNDQHFRGTLTFDKGAFFFNIFINGTR